MRSPDLAAAAVQLDKMELCGKPMTVQRAKGYVEPAQPVAAAAFGGLGGIPGLGGLPGLAGGAPQLGMPGMAAAMPPQHLPPPPPLPATPAPTNVVVLENVLLVGAVRNEQERTELHQVRAGVRD